MTRPLTAPMQAASEAATIAPVYFVKLEFDAGAACFHTALGDISFGGDTYLGQGDIAEISQVDESVELVRSSLSMTLRGLPTDLLTIVLAEHYQGRPATLFLGYFDPATMQLIADPVVIYRGRMDKPTIEQGETMSVSLTVESRFAAWDKPRVRRYNHADQRLRYPDDKGFEFVEQAVEKRILWGQPK